MCSSFDVAVKIIHLGWSVGFGVAAVGGRGAVGGRVVAGAERQVDTGVEQLPGGGFAAPVAVDNPLAVGLPPSVFEHDVVGADGVDNDGQSALRSQSCLTGEGGLLDVKSGTARAVKAYFANGNSPGVVEHGCEPRLDIGVVEEPLCVPRVDPDADARGVGRDGLARRGVDGYDGFVVGPAVVGVYVDVEGQSTCHQS